jgi:hypothetical protein
MCPYFAFGSQIRPSRCASVDGRSTFESGKNLRSLSGSMAYSLNVRKPRPDYSGRGDVASADQSPLDLRPRDQIRLKVSPLPLRQGDRGLPSLWPDHAIKRPRGSRARPPLKEKTWRTWVRGRGQASRAKERKPWRAERRSRRPEPGSGLAPDTRPVGCG